ncbi:hypothetical protein NDU88_006798 [Pleurodeles waltl]|uniref:Uncharacterized protein n=1 Tax=Pleurodeles waltl TaxID=8319 RepID=A0AAV7WYL0_PLEWA|nr:hypothetical protein NDU88_006798 [Pleurodeles waltl]
MSSGTNGIQEKAQPTGPAGPTGNKGGGWRPTLSNRKKRHNKSRKGTGQTRNKNEKKPQAETTEEPTRGDEKTCQQLEEQGPVQETPEPEPKMEAPTTGEEPRDCRPQPKAELETETNM